MATKEVLFSKYCPQCKHYDKLAHDDPCWDCLNQGYNYDSHKPIKFEEKEEKENNA